MIRRKRKYDVVSGSSGEDVVRDYFQEHFTETLDPSLADTMMARDSTKNERRISVTLEGIGTGLYEQRSGEGFNTVAERQELKNFGLCSHLFDHFGCLNGPMTSSQLSLYNVIGKYVDLYAAGIKTDCTPLYCLHAINHVTRTRNLVIQNKHFLEERRGKGTLTEDDIERARDQGLSRPKVLIICPMKKDAFQVIENFRKLIFGDSDKPFVSHYQRFISEYGDTGFKISEKRKVSDDYRKLMSGNIDDCFRIGIAIAKKSLKLYTAFDESDILVTSPLGLRLIIGEETNFLASIEVLIIDKADLLLMQNWGHLLDVVGSLHERPKKLTVDISRVRQWSLAQLTKLYRQTIMISAEPHAECDALFAVHCRNYAGFVELHVLSQGQLENITIPYCQELHRIDVEEAEYQSDIRLKFFRERILPKCESGTAIFISSYFDYVRIRNYLKNENESFVQLHEYAKEGKVAKARSLFFKKEKKLMLITERFDFYRRYNIKGIKSLIFYQPPTQSIFYHELINQVDSECAYVRLLYTKFDFLRMANIFGERCTQGMMCSKKSTHVLISR